MTMDHSLEPIIDAINETLGTDPEHAYGLDGSYGGYRLTINEGSAYHGPRLPRGQMRDFLMAFLGGAMAGKTAGMRPMREVHDALWPRDDIDVPWDSEVLEEVGDIVRGAIPGYYEEKRKAYDAMLARDALNEGEATFDATALANAAIPGFTFDPATGEYTPDNDAPAGAGESVEAYRG